MTPINCLPVVVVWMRMTPLKVYIFEYFRSPDGGTVWGLEGIALLEEIDYSQSQPFCCLHTPRCASRWSQGRSSQLLALVSYLPECCHSPHHDGHGVLNNPLNHKPQSKHCLSKVTWVIVFYHRKRKVIKTEMRNQRHRKKILCQRPGLR